MRRSRPNSSGPNEHNSSPFQHLFDCLQGWTDYSLPVELSVWFNGSVYTERVYAERMDMLSCVLGRVCLVHPGFPIVVKPDR
jgi:hypothetical protein